MIGSQKIPGDELSSFRWPSAPTSALSLSFSFLIYSLFLSFNFSFLILSSAMFALPSLSSLYNTNLLYRVRFSIDFNRLCHNSTFCLFSFSLSQSFIIFLLSIIVIRIFPFVEKTLDINTVPLRLFLKLHFHSYC